jgi:DNA-binding beta-propeller fold protein YncE
MPAPNLPAGPVSDPARWDARVRPIAARKATGCLLVPLSATWTEQRRAGRDVPGTQVKALVNSIADRCRRTRGGKPRRQAPVQIDLISGILSRQGEIMRKIAVVLTLVFVPALFAQSSSYRITHTYTLGGEGRWDYVVPDPPNHRVFIARQNRLMVVDENTGKLLGEVTGIDGAHGTALAPATGHGFATSGNDQSVVMFDLKTYAVLGRIPAAEDADAILYDSVSNRVFTLNGDAHSSTVIDPAAGKGITNIPLGGKPEYGASAGDGKVYANLTDIGEVVEIDAKAATVSRRWSTAPCERPVSMAIDTAHHRLFSGCRSGVMAVSDYQAGKVIATLPIGQGVDGAGYDPASGNAFASCVDGTLTVIHQDSPDKYHVAQTLKTQEGSRNMGLDPTNHHIYIVGAKFGPTPSGRGRPPVLPGTFSLMVVERK